MRFNHWLNQTFRTQTLGERGERQAARFLRRQGCQIIATRRRMRYGEIDVIAVEDRTVVFVEVKTRRNADFARPALAVDVTRRQRMTRAATAYLKSHGLLEYPSRFDIVEVVWPASARRPTITHHRNAFQAEGRGQFYR